jgi:hypothetical protein
MSIFDRKFVHVLPITRSQVQQIESYCEQQIGPRLFYTRRLRGGRDWYIATPNIGQVELAVRESHHLTWLALSVG